MLVNVTVTRGVGAYRKGSKIRKMPEYYARQLVAMGVGTIDLDGQEEAPRKKRAYKRRDLRAE